MGARDPNEVGSPGHPGADGGHQTAQQDALTKQGRGGRSDAERAKAWPTPEAADADRDEPMRGGSSQGQSDRTPSGA